ncbi:MAG: aspartate--ammonia ligase [Clostridia bacterium]|nr:aspartate--ammonia ligase [Clostridia bacterium]
MRDLQIIDGYKPVLTVKETQKAIKLVKDTFANELAAQLNLDRVSAPFIVKKGSGINDDLNGIERKVEFDIKEISGTAEIVQSLAKWKRTALKKYGYEVGEGLYTNMNAIRRDDDCDNIHSIFVDQWDWERVISREERNVEFLKDIVKKIVKAVDNTQKIAHEKFPQLTNELGTDVFFITTQELEDMYPDLTTKERENALLKEKKCVFLMQIGDLLKSGIKHDGRAPDYDDWKLNGDLLFWNETLGRAFEVSSMGIRVDADSLAYQLKAADAEDRMQFDYHKGIADGTLPLTIGGGIGQSRLSMLILEKAHIGEVQVSLWPDEMMAKCAENNIAIL